MRVRHFHSFLQEQGLLKVSKIDMLRGKRVGIDALYWLRTILSFADPLGPATGSVCAELGELLQQEVELLQKAGITPVFVFQGIEPRGHRLFFQLPPEQQADPWHYYYNGQREMAQELFAGHRGFLGPEEEEVALQLLKEMGVEVLQAAYLATAQLAYMVETGSVFALIGPPSLLLFGATHAITQVDYNAGVFYWAHLNYLLDFLKLTAEQLVDCCLLAGTDYCLTFPYLNLAQFQQGSAGFSFGAAVDFIRQMPMELYLQQFPDAEMKSEHVDGYCVGKCLITYPLVIKESGQVEPLVGLNAATSAQPRSPPRPPKDLNKVVGVRLPAAVYLLLAEGLLSKQLVSALAQGEWLDSLQPSVESAELRDLFYEIVHYRCRALGLVAVHLNDKFKTRRVFFARVGGERGCLPSGGPSEPSVAESLPPCINEATSRRWLVNAASLATELRRQGRTCVDMGFCLKWLANAEASDVPLFDRPAQGGSVSCSSASSGTPNLRTSATGAGSGGGNSAKGRAALAATAPSEALDRDSLLALALFYFLDAVEYFDDGNATIFGSALAEVPSDLQEFLLVALELLKFGVLTGDPLEALKGREFPPGVYEAFELPEGLEGTSEAEFDSAARSCVLLQRVASLLPLQLVPGMHWRGDLSHDLSAYAGVVSLLRGALRQLAEAALARVLLSDCSLLKLLPGAGQSAKNFSSWLPRFQSWGCCLGLVMRFFLQYKPNPAAAPPAPAGPPASGGVSGGGSGGFSGGAAAAPVSTAAVGGKGALAAFEAALRVEYPSAKDPLRDLCKAIRFWNTLNKVLCKINNFVDASVVLQEMETASKVLRRRVELVQLNLHPDFPAEGAFFGAR